MIYDSNGFERFSLEQQLDFLIIKYKFVFTSNNIKEEVTEFFFISKDQQRNLKYRIQPLPNNHDNN